jgi:hypothetical protein
MGRFSVDSAVGAGIASAYSTTTGSNYALKLGTYYVNTGVNVKPWEADDSTYSAACGVLKGTTTGTYGVNLWSDPYNSFGNYIKFFFTTDVYTTWLWGGDGTVWIKIDAWLGYDGTAISFYLGNGIQWKLYKVS